MHTLEIRLEGEFYDSYIYSGHLYLWTLDQRIISLDWDALVQSLEAQQADGLPLECAFRRSSLLYQSDIAHILRDSEIQPVVLEKFNRLGQQPFEVPAASWSAFITHENDNPVPFPHADIAVYLKQLFVCSAHGVWKGDLRTAKSRPMTNRALEVLSDAPCFDIAFWNRIVAMASGSNGAFQMNVGDERGWLGISDEPEVLTTEHTQAVEWMYGSVFCSSDLGGVLLDYTPFREDDQGSRQLRGTFAAGQLFGEAVDGRYTWGAKEKLCAASQTSVAVTKYSHYAGEDEERLTDLGEFRFERPLHSLPIKADSSYFGYVLETDDGLVILGSNGETRWIDGEPVNWRLFRTSIDYVNQLHVAWDDHLSILSFNDDYLVSQPDKRIGLSFWAGAGRRQQPRRQQARSRGIGLRPRLHDEGG